MTWKQLDDQIGNVLEDMYGYWFDIPWDEQLYSCDALTGVIECLEQYDYPTNSFGQITDNHAEYLDNQRLIKELEAIR